MLYAITTHLSIEREALFGMTATDLPKNDYYGFIPLDDYDDVVVAYPNHRFGKATIYISRCDIFESIAHQFKGLSARLSALESK